MPVEIEKTRRVRFVASKRLVEDEPYIIRANHFCPPENVIDTGDGVFTRCTLLPDRNVFEVWQVREVA
jgi:hypothetical protein